MEIDEIKIKGTIKDDEGNIFDFNISARNGNIEFSIEGGNIDEVGAEHWFTLIKGKLVYKNTWEIVERTHTKKCDSTRWSFVDRSGTPEVAKATKVANQFYKRFKTSIKSLLLAPTSKPSA